MFSTAILIAYKSKTTEGEALQKQNGHGYIALKRYDQHYNEIFLFKQMFKYGPTELLLGSTLSCWKGKERRKERKGMERKGKEKGKERKGMLLIPKSILPMASTVRYVIPRIQSNLGEENKRATE